MSDYVTNLAARALGMGMLRPRPLSRFESAQNPFDAGEFETSIEKKSFPPQSHPQDAAALAESGASDMDSTRSPQPQTSRAHGAQGFTSQQRAAESIPFTGKSALTSQPESREAVWPQHAEAQDAATIVESGKSAATSAFPSQPKTQNDASAHRAVGPDTVPHLTAAGRMVPDSSSAVVTSSALPPQAFVLRSSAEATPAKDRETLSSSNSVFGGSNPGRIDRPPARADDHALRQSPLKPQAVTSSVAASAERTIELREPPDRANVTAQRQAGLTQAEVTQHGSPTSAGRSDATRTESRIAPLARAVTRMLQAFPPRKKGPLRKPSAATVKQRVVESERAAIPSERAKVSTEHVPAHDRRAATELASTLQGTPLSHHEKRTAEPINASMNTPRPAAIPVRPVAGRQGDAHGFLEHAPRHTDLPPTQADVTNEVIAGPGKWLPEQSIHIAGVEKFADSARVFASHGESVRLPVPLGFNVNATPPLPEPARVSPLRQDEARSVAVARLPIDSPAEALMFQTASPDVQPPRLTSVPGDTPVHRERSLRESVSAAVALQKLAGPSEAIPKSLNAAPEHAELPAPPARRLQRTVSPPPAVVVTIGRLEVRAAPQPPMPVPPRRRSVSLTLGNYLRRRAGGATHE